MKKNVWQKDFVCTFVGLILNAVLTVFKLFAGIVGRSHAMIADSIHSLSDEIATIITFFALKLSQKPEDTEHPYGHGNIEAIASWMVAFLLFVTGIFLGYSALHSIIHKHYSSPTKIALIAAISSIIIKELLYRYTMKIGRELNSPILKANARDHRSDALSSLGSLIGIAGARMGFHYMDPAASIVISIMIFKMGIDIMHESNRILMDSSPGQELLTDWNKCICNHPGIKGNPHIRVHPIGRKFVLEITISVDKSLSVIESHNIATNLQNKMMLEKEEIKDIIIHIEPFEE